ncbi:IclR family transcriptional regulator [Mesobacterium pallidum]|uniref:IclR family transcriptional regulator n=1 Tax=Mesobacterium pallidum TaxID=2872037 RepID=UPI001EE19D09|nr:helix-turn-helix domain-containing protein [Mesobacterium pallidum]
MKGGARGIQSIEVSGRILDALIISGEPMMLKDLAEAAGLKPAQCHAYLTSLKNVGLVHQDWATGHYSAGPAALRLGVSWLQSDSMTAQTVEELKAITEELGVMSLITVWGQFGPTIVHIYAGLTQAALNLRQGSLFSVTGTAAGRVFAAYCHGPEIRAQVEDELAHRAVSPSLGEELTTEDFDAHMRDIEKHGYSAANEKPIPGVNAVAVPLFGADGRLRLVASLIGGIDRLPVGEADLPVQRMLALSKRLSRGAPAPVEG